MASSSNSPCAACKFVRRKCQTECVFAPYFPPDQPQKFSNVHKVFGASNVTSFFFFKRTMPEGLAFLVLGQDLANPV
ncbi:hypothetical protein SADUNF_Sadunf13G0044400 [Salix dunnii]|uniref:LOB domain-containing protein n=1 Tax=Salix dunnii TaxID=1413687 RepID=A0A835MKS3_9ROSI|nr:hypothetical protein SADUNF_Sadunf13G0044400 [Salix dunnii]